MSTTFNNDGESCFTDGFLSFAGNSMLCEDHDSHHVFDLNSQSIEDQMVSNFLINQAALVQPVPAVHIAIPGQYNRIRRRRETRAILNEHYARQKKLLSAKETDNARRKHAASRPRIQGRFPTKQELAAMEHVAGWLQARIRGLNRQSTATETSD